MKRVIVMLTAVIMCSLSAWCQSSMIVTLGTEVLENITLSSAKESFKQRGMPLEKFPSGKFGYLSEHPVLMAAIDVTSANKIKEVSFLCGTAMWWEIEIYLEEAGFILSKDGTATLATGDVVPQKTYAKGTLLCLVQTLDNNMKQVVFKRKPVNRQKKSSSKR